MSCINKKTGYFSIIIYSINLKANLKFAGYYSSAST